jgi:hypothetical protein
VEHSRRAWPPVVAAAALTVGTLLVMTFGDAAQRIDRPDVVHPAARVAEDRAQAPAAPATQTVDRLPRWCRHAAACVDKRARVAWLTDHGRILRGPVPVSLGGRGHRTPSGRFHVEWKAAHWTSTEYGLPMPYSVFFATGGIAFHAGPLDEPSHGCVHLRRHDASRFFDRLQVGDAVAVR